MGDWKQNIIVSCFSNISLSCTICLLAPIAIYNNAEKVGEPGLAWIIGGLACPGSLCFLRQKIAQKQGIKEHSFLSFVWWCFVPCLALCQEAKTLGTMEKYIAPEMQEIERQAEKKVQK